MVRRLQENKLKTVLFMGYTLSFIISVGVSASALSRTNEIESSELDSIESISGCNYRISPAVTETEDPKHIFIKMLKCNVCAQARPMVVKDGGVVLNPDLLTIKNNFNNPTTDTVLLIDGQTMRTSVLLSYAFRESAQNTKNIYDPLDLFNPKNASSLSKPLHDVNWWKIAFKETPKIIYVKILLKLSSTSYTETTIRPKSKNIQINEFYSVYTDSDNPHVILADFKAPNGLHFRRVEFLKHSPIANDLFKALANLQPIIYRNEGVNNAVTSVEAHP